MAQTAPVAVNDTYTVNEDNALSVNPTLGVLRNDSDPDGNTITAIIVSGASFGILSLNSDGSFTYTPLLNFNGMDTFSYVANDGILNSTQANANITVNPVNDIPVARNDSYSVNEDNTLTIANPGVLLNDTDSDGNALTTSLVTNVIHGTLLLGSNGGFSYTPTANFNGMDSFSYNASDGSAKSNTATVNIKVNSINDIPVASADSYSVNENQTLTIASPGILSNDTDSDSNTLTTSIVTNVSHGTLALNPNGSFTYKPTLNFDGIDSFTYNINDGSTNSNTATVTIKINPVNPPTTDDILLKLLDQIQNLLHRITGLETDVADLKEKNHTLESRILQLETLLDEGVNNHDSNDDKVKVCHIPPGNPGNAHTIKISKSALAAHLAHGDTQGACLNDDKDGDDHEDENDDDEDDGEDHGKHHGDHNHDEED